RATGRDDQRLGFTPVLVPMSRGILAVCTAPVSEGTTTEDLLAALAADYAEEHFVTVLPEGGFPTTGEVAGATTRRISAVVDRRARAGLPDHRRGGRRQPPAHRRRGGPPQRPGHRHLGAGQPRQGHGRRRDPVPEPGSGDARGHRAEPHRARPLTSPVGPEERGTHTAPAPGRRLASRRSRAPPLPGASVSITRPRGFRAVGLPAGIKSTGAPDLAVI